MDYRDAIKDVTARVKASRTSFHTGMNILPKARREAMYALYAFSRAVDDIADDSSNAEDSTRGLRQWRERISALFRGAPSDAITVALAPAIQAFGLVEGDFQAIIDGMEMDAGTAAVAVATGGAGAEPSRRKNIVAPNMAMLDLYCDRVASAVGRVSVRIFGDGSTAAMDVAHHLGRAFQLTNILRDLAEDAARGRLYLPEELLAKHGIASRAPVEVLRESKLPAVCRDLAALARTHFAASDLAMRSCDAAAMRPARMMRAYYKAIFDRLVTEDWRDPARRITLPKWQKILLVLKGLTARG